MAADLGRQLQESLGQSYTVERELGRGGMSCVFIAVDRELGRRVVIKLLSPDLAAGISARRFAREIRLAASLQQANIVPVLATGEMQGLPYYTMPFVDGLSLRDRLDRTEGRALPVAEAVSVLRDVARALAFAHDRSIVHRDIKPDNILLSGDAAVVTDFGIAKAISAARQDGSTKRTSGSTVTRTGTALGTPVYMAPEQVTADPGIDHRADLYAFGCVAYELFTGAAPFAKRPAHQVLAAHVMELPVPVRERRADCPPDIARIVMQCLEKDPVRRPQSAREILKVLDGLAPAAPLSVPSNRRVRLVAFVSVVVAAVVAAWPWSPWSPLRQGSDRQTIAVLPFENVGGDSTQEYLADGIADGLTTALGRVGGIRIVSRTLSHRYRETGIVDLRQTALALGTDRLVQGSLRRLGGRLRVSVQLTSARDSSEIWSDTYERDAADVMSVPDRIAHDIATALHAGGNERRGAPTAATTTGPGTANVEAYDLYMRGRYLLQRRGGRVQQAIEKFEEAIAKDSGFASAYAGLSGALELLPYFAEVPASDVRDRAVAAAQRALSIDSTLAEAHTSLALAHGHAYEWKLAEEEHRRAIAVDPGNAAAHMQYGRFLRDVGRLVEAKAEFARARTLDPYFTVASGWLAHELWLAGREDEALIEIGRALEMDSTIAPVRTFAMEIYARLGRPTEVRRLLQGFPRGSPPWDAVMMFSYLRIGDTASARQLLRSLESRRPPPPKAVSATAYMYLALGDTARALDLLERATDAAEPWPTDYSPAEFIFDGLRRSPRFAALLRRLRLDVQVFTSPTGGRPR